MVKRIIILFPIRVPNLTNFDYTVLEAAKYFNVRRRKR